MLVEPNFEEMPKVAFVGAALSRFGGFAKNLAGRFFRQGAGRYLGGRAVATAPYKALAPYADKAEKALIHGIGKIAPGYEQQAGVALKRVGRRALSEAIPSAGIGGVLGGVGGALTAEEGERGKGFLRGAAGGIGMGALSGAVSGVGTGVVSNLQGQALRNAGKAHGVAGPAVRDQFKNTGFFKSIPKAFGKEDNLERSLARTKLTAGAGMVGANFVLPELVYPSAPGQPPPPKQPPLNPNQPSVYYQNQGQKFGAAMPQAVSKLWNRVSPDVKFFGGLGLMGGMVAAPEVAYLMRDKSKDPEWLQPKPQPPQPMQPPAAQALKPIDFSRLPR